MDTDSFIIHEDIADDVKKDMINQIMRSTDHYQKKWMKHQRVNERWTRRKDHDRTGYS